MEVLHPGKYQLPATPLQVGKQATESPPTPYVLCFIGDPCVGWCQFRSILLWIRRRHLRRTLSWCNASMLRTIPTEIANSEHSLHNNRFLRRTRDNDDEEKAMRAFSPAFFGEILVRDLGSILVRKYAWRFCCTTHFVDDKLHFTPYIGSDAFSIFTTITHRYQFETILNAFILFSLGKQLQQLFIRVFKVSGEEY